MKHTVIVALAAAFLCVFSRGAFAIDGSRLTDGNVLVRRIGGGPQEIRVGVNTRMHAERSTFLGLHLTMRSPLPKSPRVAP